jgi:molecular chaperone Hsp33
MLLTFEAPGMRVLVCVVREAAREAQRRHHLAAGSAAALAQAMAGALLLAAHDQTRVDVQLECNGPLQGLLVDAEPDGAIRGLVRVGTLEATNDPDSRFDPRSILASPHDERAGRISILRANADRAAFPFAGANIGAALTFFLRNDRAAGGEMAIEALVRDAEPIAAGVLLAPFSEEDCENVRGFGKPMRQGILRDALRQEQDAGRLATCLPFGPLRLVSEITPHFACRCSRERVLNALRTLGPEELDDMAEKDHGADLTCDFCSATYRIEADELIRLASR